MESSTTTTSAQLSQKVPWPFYLCFAIKLDLDTQSKTFDVLALDAGYQLPSEKKI